MKQQTLFSLVALLLTPAVRVYAIEAQQICIHALDKGRVPPYHRDILPVREIRATYRGRITQMDGQPDALLRMHALTEAKTACLVLGLGVQPQRTVPGAEDEEES